LFFHFSITVQENELQFLLPHAVLYKKTLYVGNKVIIGALFIKIVV